VQASGETLQEFAAAIEQLAHRAFVGLPVTFVQTEAAHSFIDGVREREVKQHLLRGGHRTLNEALNQALKLEAAKAAAGPPARLRELTGAPARASQLPDRRRDGRPLWWECGSAGHLRRLDGSRVRTGTGETSKCGEKRGPPESLPSTRRFTLNILGQGTHYSLIAEGWIQRKPCQVTIDTGASVTIA
jgi:hypothetical protein